jgi:glycosyltransferase involved in cell wall biosynthesis
MQKVPEPFFSILIATFNAKQELVLCIDSILQQDFDDYEILISDGGSSDGTLKYIQETKIGRLSWYKSVSDSGIYDALNITSGYSSGRWILVLGADDRLADSGALRRAHALIDAQKLEYGLIYSDLFISGSNGIRLKKYLAISEFSNQYSRGPFIHHQSAFVARKSILQLGGFSDKYRIHADYDLMLKVLELNGAVKIDDAFVVYNAYGFSSKLSRLWCSFSEIYQIRKTHGYQPVVFRILLTYIKLVVLRIFIK